MAVDRSLWAETFSEKLPHWPCPTCGKGHLVAKKDMFWIEETGLSLAAHNHEAWDPDWIINRFVGFLECSMPACKELASVSGSAGVDQYQVDWDEYKIENIFTVSAINPTPMPILYPIGTPDNIVESIRRSASLFWLSPESSANQIRQAVEYLMDDVGIPSTNPLGKPINLHSRILQFQATDAENGEVLLAAKWLGNTGSHSGSIGRDDVLDAFDMIEFVLENRYGTTKAQLMAKVAAINAAKGPVAAP